MGRGVVARSQQLMADRAKVTSARTAPANRQHQRRRRSAACIVLGQPRSPQLSGTSRLRVTGSSGPSPKSRPLLLLVLSAVVVSAGASMPSPQPLHQLGHQHEAVLQTDAHLRVEWCLFRCPFQLLAHTAQCPEHRGGSQTWFVVELFQES